MEPRDRKQQQELREGQKIADGARLEMAFKSEAGQVILASLEKPLGEDLNYLLFSPATDAELLTRLYEVRGALRHLSALGEKMRAAKAFISRRALDTALAYTRNGRAPEAGEE